jgi:hypothetical protein
MRRLAWWLVLACAACGGDGNSSGFNSVKGAPAITTPSHVWAFAPDNVWILDGTAAVQHFDGSSWTPLDTKATGGVGCIFALSPTDVWLCADTQALHYNGTTFTPSDVMTPTGLSGLSAIWASSANDVYAVGMDAIVAHYNGTTWSKTIVGEPNKTSIWGSGPGDIYTLGTFDLSHWNGTKWSPVALDSGAGDGQVWGTSATDVWAMVGSSQVSHFDGTKWTTTDLNIVGELSAVWGATPDDVWASGSAGSISHWDGKAWSELTHQKIGAPFLQQLVSVHGTGADDVWIVGQQLGNSGSTPLILHRGP